MNILWSMIAMMRLRKEATADARYMKRLIMQVELEWSAPICVNGSLKEV